MEQEQTIQSFLKSLRISLNYISLYSKEHKAFVKACAGLKKSLDEVFTFQEPLEVGFSPDKLIIGYAEYAKQPLHLELAKMFHARKIKSIAFRRGVTEAELSATLSAVSRPVKELLSGGGVNAVIPPGSIEHVSIQELDYSVLLKSEGEGTGDVWTYLLKGSLDEEGYRKIDEFVETFDAMVGKITGKELVNDAKLRENVFQLLDYIKSRDPEKYSRYIKTVLGAVLRDKSIPADAALTQLRQAVSGMDTQTLSSILWEEISSDDKFDNANLELFSALVSKDRHEQIADTLVKTAGRERSSTLDPQRMKRIHNLFAVPQGQSFVSDIYRKALSSISENTYFGRGFSFDRNKLSVNFRRVLVNIFVLEHEAPRRDPVIRAMLGAWDDAKAHKDMEFFTSVGALLACIPPAGRTEAFGELEIRFDQYVEEQVWEQDAAEWVSRLVSEITKSTLGEKYYLSKFFEKGIIKPEALTLFFRLFPDKLEAFDAQLVSRSQDLEFMTVMIDALGKSESVYAVERLEKIFAVSNDLIRAEVLKTMAELPNVDREFLFTVLAQGAAFLRKEALLILAKDYSNLQHAFDILLAVPNFWGRKNKLLLENLSIIEEARLPQAREHVGFLCRGFVFNAPVARKARQVLEKLHV